MLNGVTLDREHRLLIARPQGAVSVDRCRRLFRTMRGLEGSQRYDRYIDLSEVDDVHLNYDEIWWLARHCSSNWNSDQSARCIVHAERDMPFGIARMFQSLVESKHVTIAVCRSRAEAAVALGVSIDLLEQTAAT